MTKSLLTTINNLESKALIKILDSLDFIGNDYIIVSPYTCRELIKFLKLELCISELDIPIWMIIHKKDNKQSNYLNGEHSKTYDEPIHKDWFVTIKYS